MTDNKRSEKGIPELWPSSLRNSFRGLRADLGVDDTPAH
jgi:hypothetical protein